MGEDRITERPGAAAPYWVVPIVLAVGAAWLLRLLVEWLADLVGGPFAAVTSIGEPWLTVGTFGLGVLVGGLIALAISDMALTVAVSAEQVRLRHDGTRRRSRAPTSRRCSSRASTSCCSGTTAASWCTPSAS
jgi:hypothetical protein